MNTVDINYFDTRDTPTYYADINIFGIPVTLYVSYNTRVKKRVIMITSQGGGICYLKNTYITKKDRIFLNFNFRMNDLDVYACLAPKGDVQPDHYLNWSEFYSLAFVSLPEDETQEATFMVSNIED